MMSQKSEPIDLPFSDEPPEAPAPPQGWLLAAVAICVVMIAVLLTGVV